MDKKAGKGRIWVPKDISSVAHPTRQAIIRSLENGTKTTRELEEELNESRYNLYHHLKTLKDQNLIVENLKGRVKSFKLASDLENDTINLEDLTKELDALSAIPQKKDDRPFVFENKLGESPMELELDGDMLNQVLSQVGEKQLNKKQSYRVFIVPGKKKKGGK